MNRCARGIIFFFFFLMAGASYALGAGIKLIENKGQWEENILFRGYIPGGCFYAEKNTFTYFFYDEKKLHDIAHNYAPTKDIKCHTVKLKFTDANPNPGVEFYKPSSENYSFFKGDNPAKWAGGVKAYRRIIFTNLWLGIDLEILVEDEALKYNLIVHPGADASKVKMNYEGADNLKIQEDGSLVAHTSLTSIIEQKPIAYTGDGELAKNISCNFSIQKNEVSFSLGKYNHKEKLVIDPKVIFSTYSGSVADNFGFTATYDHEGNGYSGGTVYDVKFPTTSGAFQTNYAGGYTDNTNSVFGRDCGILKYSPDGKNLLYCTYIGGKHNEQPHSMVIDRSGNLIIYGTTESNDFPVVTGSYDTKYNGKGDMFLLSISPDGKKLNSSTYLGGSNLDGFNGASEEFPYGTLGYNYADRYRGEVIVDSNGDVVVSACTFSSDFPTKNAYQSSIGGVLDACIFKMNAALNTLYFSTFMGGQKDDAGYGINFDKNGNYFICGGTMSSDFPAKNGLRTSAIGDVDGFIIKLKEDGSFIASTYLGTASYDQSFFVQTDDANRVYVYGQSRGDMPVVGNVYSNKGGKQFISVYDNDLSKIVLATVVGTGRNVPDLSPSAFLVDLCGRVCLSGWGGELLHFYKDNNSVKGLPITSDAFQNTSEDGNDFYMMVLSREMTSLVYSTYLGGGVSDEHVDGGTSRFDREGKIYQSVCGGCGGYSDFPTTQGAWSRINKGKRPKTGEGGCNNALFKLDVNSSNYAPQALDTTLVVTATETLDYSFEVKDYDKYDSVYVDAVSKIFDTKNIALPVAVLTGKKGYRTVNCRLTWNTICAHASTDTYFVYLNYYDNGCPTPRSSKGVIKIVVNAPPKPKAPGIFCLHRINPNTVKVEWGDFETNKYVDKYYLVKRQPTGNTQVLTTFSKTLTTGNFFIDSTAYNHLTTDYRYFIYGVNICGEQNDSTREISTLPRKDSIPEPVYIFTVTVEENKNIRLIWNKSSRDDFYLYQVYRKRNIAGDAFVKIHSSYQKTDTSFLDIDVNVQKYSYCYKMIMFTQCGLTSGDGNTACSILLKGDAIPFENSLAWNPYATWQGGVEGYEIMRREDKDFFKRDDVSAAANTYSDVQLNVDWGLYHYRIIAHEGAGGKGATSVSNDVDLIQLPIVYMPNVFTPDGNGINDSLTPAHAFVRDWHLRVYNRWGERMFDSYNKHHSWDAIYRDNDPFNNVYIWQIEYSGWDDYYRYKMGNVTVIK